MEYIKIENNMYNKEDIKKVTEIVKMGGVVILPTDTVYGVAADCLNEEAVKKVYEFKHRDFSKPCNILVSDIEMIRKVTKGLSEKEEKIINNLFPGALTIICEKNDVIPGIVNANLSTIGIRMPNNQFLLDLISNIGRPIVATSLNLAGEKSMTNLNNLPEDFKKKSDLIIDGGETTLGTASTIIKVENGKVKILREGPIDMKKIEQVMEEERC